MATSLSTDNYTSLIVEDQFPEFAKEEGPNLIAFVKAYYEWMETTGQMTNEAKNLQDYADIDNTLDQFVQYFEGEVMDTIPKTIAADKRLLAKHIRDLYVAKGSQEAFRLLFRMLYDEEIDFYYPGIDMLRASDGRWVEETSVRLSNPSTGELLDLAGQVVTGLTSSAQAKVERVEGTTELGIPVRELFLSGVSGTFVDGETVRNPANTINGTVFSVTGPINSISITQGGHSHRVGDVVRLTGTTTGTGANAVIATTDNESAITFTLLAGGSGYRVSETVGSVISGVGSGASFSVDSIGNTEFLTFATTTIDQMASVPIGAGPTYGTSGSNTQTLEANIAGANASSVLSSALNFDTVETGTITGITPLLAGQGYSVLPTVRVRDQVIFELERSDPNGGVKGGNAKVVASYLSGAILTINIDAIGSAYDKYADVLIQNLSRAGTLQAQGRPSVTGLVNHPGKYVDTKGYLSWNNRLQDNYYYQEYSYVVRSKQFVNKYRDVVKKLIHPAGTALFGRFQVDVEMDRVAADAPDSIINRRFFSDQHTVIPEVVSQTVEDYVADPNIGAVQTDLAFANTDYEENVVSTQQANVVTPSATTWPYTARIERTANVQPTVSVYGPLWELDVAAEIQTILPSVANRGLPTIEPSEVQYATIEAVIQQPIIEANTVQATVELAQFKVTDERLASFRFGPDFSFNRKKLGHHRFFVSQNSPIFDRDNSPIADDEYIRTTPDIKSRIDNPAPSANVQASLSVESTEVRFASIAANTTALAITSSGRSWFPATGNVEIIVSGVIDDYDHLQISVYEAVAINSLGTDQAVARDDEDSTTVFTNEIANGDTIFIHNQTNTAVANIMFTVDKVYSDALLTISNSYPVVPVSNAVVYVANTFTIITSNTS